MNTSDASKLNVLWLESYAAGSHLRVVELLRRYSRHSITWIGASRNHWKRLAMLGHVEIADLIKRQQLAVPDLLIFSGATDLPALILGLPNAYLTVPRVTYFHESQWTYPTRDDDTRPYLVQHLNAIRYSNEVWFNSRFHLNEFISSATSPPTDRMIRRHAERVLTDSGRNMYVLYPPVRLDHLAHEHTAAGTNHRLLWNARWELDKRPDLFAAIYTRLAESGAEPEALILGTGGVDRDVIATQLGRPASVPGHLPDRSAYEHALASGGIILSTAGHEFFGIAVLEATLAGNIPVLPGSLAYPETMPSAWLYRDWQAEDAVRTIQAARRWGQHTWPMHRSDASRFAPERIVPEWDDAMQRVVQDSRSDR